VNQGLRYAGFPRPVSFFAICISLLYLPISLEEIHKWKREIHKWVWEICISLKEIHISLVDLPISSEETHSADPTFTTRQLALHRRTRLKPSVEESPTLLYDAV